MKNFRTKKIKKVIRLNINFNRKWEASKEEKIIDVVGLAIMILEKFENLKNVLF